MAKTKTPGVYKITNTVNGRVYYGSTQDYHARIKGHRGLLARGKHHNHGLQADYERGHLFDCELIKSHESRTARDALEHQLYTSDPTSYNVTGKRKKL